MLTKMAVAALAGTLGVTALAGTASADEGWRHQEPCPPTASVAARPPYAGDHFDRDRLERERMAEWRMRQEQVRLARLREERRLAMERRWAWERAHHAYYDG